MPVVSLETFKTLARGKYRDIPKNKKGVRLTFQSLARATMQAARQAKSEQVTFLHLEAALARFARIKQEVRSELAPEERRDGALVERQRTSNVQMIEAQRFIENILK